MATRADGSSGRGRRVSSSLAPDAKRFATNARGTRVRTRARRIARLRAQGVSALVLILVMMMAGSLWLVRRGGNGAPRPINSIGAIDVESDAASSAKPSFERRLVHFERETLDHASPDSEEQGDEGARRRGVDQEHQRGFHSHRAFPSAREIAKDTTFNPSGRVLQKWDEGGLQELIDEVNARLVELERQKIEIAQSWARTRISFGDYEYVTPGITYPRREDGAISVTVDDASGPLPKLVVIRPGEHAALDLASINLEAAYQEARLAIISHFDAD